MKPQKDEQMQNRSDHHLPSGTPHRPRKRKRPWIAILLVTAVVGASGWVATRLTGQKSDASTDGGTITVQRGNLMVTVAEGGSIRARNSIQYKCQVERMAGLAWIPTHPL